MYTVDLFAFPFISYGNKIKYCIADSQCLYILQMIKVDLWLDISNLDYKCYADWKWKGNNIYNFDNDKEFICE